MTKPETARVIRELREHRGTLGVSINRYATLASELPEWMSVEEVQALTDRSQDWVYARATELSASGRARKIARRGRGGAWVIHRDAALGLPARGAA